MTDSPAGQHAAASGSSEAPIVPPLSILALDDDEDFLQFLRGVLEADGHAVRTASTPEAFFEAAEAADPDLVLLDMKMGRYSGEAVLAEVRVRWPTLCVIIVTGYPSMEGMRQTFRLDVFDYLAKPFSLEELRRSLRQAAARFDLGLRPQDRLRQALGRQIKLARTQRGLTLRALSDAAKLSISQLSSIERGAHLPSLESLLAIASALESKPSDWLGGAGF